MFRCPAFDEQIRQHLQNVDRSHVPPDLDSQALPRVFVYDRQHLQRTTITRSIGDEVVGPDVIPVLWSKVDAGSI